MNFDHIFKWKLLAGSHNFPGPDGGTCITEAAIVAAGFPYHSIRDAAQAPPCFSRPITNFAIAVNDRIYDDDARTQLLMPFVMRLAGSADHWSVEGRRAEFIMVTMAHEVFAPLLVRAGLRLDAFRFDAARTWGEVFGAFCELKRTVRVFHQHPLHRVVAIMSDMRGADCFTSGAIEADACGRVIDVAIHLFQGFSSKRGFQYPGERIVEQAVSILDRVLAIGRQADPLDIDLVETRMAAAKTMATARPLVPA